VVIDRARIADLVPHAGAMCLLDTVAAWSAEAITCLATSHRNLDHPLRGRHGLAAVHALEYAAQATALHGALVAGGGAGSVAPAFLAAVRQARFGVRDLSAVPPPLVVSARLLAAEARGSVYACEVAGGGTPVAAAALTLIARR
jgi:predicted hotdog family 3-hydroxylacyl-ACP dehydratase